VQSRGKDPVGQCSHSDTTAHELDEGLGQGHTRDSLRLDSTGPEDAREKIELLARRIVGQYVLAREIRGHHVPPLR